MENPESGHLIHRALQRPLTPPPTPNRNPNRTPNQAEAGLVTIEWPSESQVNSRVQRSTDLLHWDFIGNIIAGTGEHLEMQDEQNESRSFYRIMGFR